MSASSSLTANTTTLYYFVVLGVVKNITKYVEFIYSEGISGLLHITDMAG